MNTQILTESEQSVQLAARLLTNGETVAIPTETVYGLAANALNSSAVKKIFAAKGRPQDNPLISHICNMDMLSLVAKSVPESALILAEKFWPGPLTMVLPRADGLADEVCAGLNSAAVRMPSHKCALAVIKACGFPLAAPSANISGSPSPTTAKHVYNDLNGKIELIIDGGACSVGVESTVISLCEEQPILLRPGGITVRQLSSALNCEIKLSGAVLNALQETEKAYSPGMKYKHYSPKASLTLIKGSLADFKKYVNAHSANGVYCLCFTGEQADIAVPCITYGARQSPEQQANKLFAALRELDDKNAETVFVRCPESEDKALAVYNRLLRAAAFKVIQL